MIGNWIRQATTSTGTGNLALSAVTGYPTFADEFATSERFAYVILDDATGAPIERGIGYMDSTPELVREAVLATYVSGTYTGANPSAVNLAAGTKRVICTGGAQSAIAGAPGVWSNSLKVYGDTHIVAALSTLVVTADRAYAIPFRAMVDADIDSISFRVSVGGAAGKLGRCGVYSMGRDGLPGVLLANGASVAVDTTGVKHSTFTRFRPPPVFFAAFLSDGAPTLNATALGLTNGAMMGADANLNPCPFIHHVGATGLTLPSPWTAVTNLPNAARPLLFARVP